MKRIFTFGFIVLFSSTLLAQKLDYDNDSKWFWGINTGAAWSTTDVKNKLNGAWGLMLGKSFNYNYGKKVSFDIRGRYLGGKWRGQDYDTTNLSGNLGYDPTGNVAQKYDTLGYTINNFQTQVHEFGLELVIHANSLRENTGWDPYIFGGLNIGFNQTKGNLLYEDTLFGDEYIYNYAPDGISRSEWRNISDDNYDLTLDGSSQNKFNVDFMPSLGFGLAYQVGPRFAIGVEHKTTFAMKDVFDGYVNPEKQWGLFENDIYHYTNAFLKFNLRRRNIGTNVSNPNTTGNNQNLNGGGNEEPCKNPKVQITSPNNNSTTVYQSEFLLKGIIEELAGRENIVFTVNGSQSTNFLFNANNEKFESTLLLSPGNNTISIKAGNACGTDVATITINYVNCVAPTVQFVSPQGNGVTVDQANFLMNASVVNAESVEYFVNGVRKTNVVYNSSTGNFSSNTFLNPGANSLRIVARNSCGSVEETVTISLTNCVSPFIVIQSGSGSQIVDNATFTLRASLTNVVNQNNVSLRLNGMNRSFTFNAATQQFEAAVSLVQGTNTFELFASNECGSDSETITVEYVPCALPKVIIISPVPQSTETSSFEVQARVQGVSGLNQIKLMVNGAYLNSGSFNASTQLYVANITLADGQNSISVIATNDCGSDTETITTVFVACSAPSIAINSPANQGTDQATFNLNTTIQGVTGLNQITLTVNGTAVNGGLFNAASNLFTANVSLSQGQNIIKIVAANNCGYETETISMEYLPCVVPNITIVAPTNRTTESSTIEVKATILGATALNQIELRVNGAIISGGSFNPASQLFIANVNLVEGQNIIKISTTNECGSDEELINLVFEECKEPVVNLLLPTSNSIEGLSTMVKASLQNITSSNQILLKVNNAVVTGGVYNPSTSIFQANVTLIEGNNTITIEATNECGSQTVTHNIKTVVVVVEEEMITICHIPPGNEGNPQEIQIPLSAWPAHQAHGDKLGPCEEIVEVEEKITICHIPPGNEGNPQEIQIPLSAWPAHQAHGDKLGPCEEIVEVEEKITICHIPPGNEGNPQEIQIPLSAWPAHQAHGDKLGPCEEIVEVEEKITICHIPPGNEGNPQEIQIPLSAWPAHQAHGDKLGPCEEIVEVEEKITICHIPPGNEGNPQEIQIPLSAWPAHQAHGDKLGPCEEIVEVEEKITICHIPPGNEGNPQEIQIPLSAWPAHQAHGDKLGPCEEIVEVEEKITICHIPPGNEGNPQEIQIPLSAWPAHQAHGDKLGPCEEIVEVEEKITICHIPPGNEGNPQEIQIPLSAWPAHQAHGDKLGPCEEVVDIQEEQVNFSSRITICHTDPKTGKKSEISILLKDWKKHKAHGDKLGSCVVEIEEEEEIDMNARFTICHVDKKTGKRETMSILGKDWKNHQVHGDTMGQCKEEEPDDTGSGAKDKKTQLLKKP